MVKSSSMKEILSKKAAANQLQISIATLNNWIQLNLVNVDGKYITSDEVQRVQSEMSAGHLVKLNSRANKSGSSASFIPSEYIQSKNNQSEVRKLIQWYQSIQLPIEVILYFTAINLFIQSDDIVFTGSQWDFELAEGQVQRDGLWKALESWRGDLPSDLSLYKNEIQLLIAKELPAEKDLLGIIYQSLLREGKKAGLGSYYTPAEVVGQLIDGKIPAGARVLDPCCGTGQFLLCFARQCLDPWQIFGFDIDQVAVRIAGCNLLLHFNKIDFTPMVFHLDFLDFQDSSVLFNQTVAMGDFDIPSEFDFIATNPPWGARLPQRQLESLLANYHEVDRGESYSFFILKSIALLKDKGILSMVLPESLCDIRAHRGVRQKILEEMKIEKVALLGRKFRKVFSSVIAIEMIKGELPDEIEVVSDSESYFVSQNRFFENSDLKFDFHVKSQDLNILQIMDEKGEFFLSDKSEWALGIVTGDNKKHLKLSPGEGLEAIYRGSDVDSFSLKPSSRYIAFEPQQFQQTASVAFYRSTEKLIYRFVSNCLVFAYDNQQQLTLNSANILIPDVPGLSMKVVALFLNSQLFQFYFSKRFNALKVLKGDLKQLPFPQLNTTQHQIAENLADALIEGADKYDEMNCFIFDLYGLSDEQRMVIAHYCLNESK